MVTRIERLHPARRQNRVSGQQHGRVVSLQIDAALDAADERLK